MHKIYEEYKKLSKFIFVSLFIIMNACDNKTPVPPSKPLVQVIKLKITTIPLTKEYIGISQSMASIDIRARVKGFLTKMNFVEGKNVKKNQLLFVIDPAPFEAKLSLAQGQLSTSIARKEYQQIEYLRM